MGWSCSAANSGYGIGGVALSTYISGTRIFMGGGGGGGQQNNSFGTDGAAGGGIILIKAGTIVSSTTCVSSISIAANGANAADSGNNGAGGGGGGGSIVLQAASFGLSATCPLTVSANGGRGGSVTNSGEHGGGGGGGQGVLIYSGAQPTANVTSQTNVGIGGANSSSSGSTSAGNGAGTNGSGITSGSLTVLPIKLMDFYGSINENKSVVLTWHTASEKNCKEFIVERSADGTNYAEITTVTAHGTTSSAHEYKAYDQLIISNLYYYRLRSVDFDAGEEISPLIAITAESNPQFVVYPNPVEKNKSLKISLREKASGSEQIQLLDMFGNCQLSILCAASQEQVEIDLAHYNLLAGVYFIKLQGVDYSITKKLLLNN